ncbi:MAG: helix-turn-helix transcriptional regulator [Lachnospiraceae bacterium]|nr:helix-turn-helix transcriptional regulator [Lachnospiraceae bacterium]
MLHYKIDVIKTLNEHGYSNSAMSRGKMFSESTMTKFRRGIIVSTSELSKLCDLLRVQPGEIIEWIPDESQDREQENQIPWYSPLS